ncbi:MAG: transglutaminase domain-containing protein [Ruminococcus sp.]|nr:transglutaminase domain-containing protein [Ruminococcus sp.]MBR1393938.1 transglutaminase domain-containing protein [Ruminococcus sp.]
MLPCIKNLSSLLSRRDSLRRLRSALLAATLAVTAVSAAGCGNTISSLVVEVNSGEPEIITSANESNTETPPSEPDSDTDALPESTTTTTSVTETEPVVTEDVTPPEVTVSDLEVYLGDSVRYKEHITVSDNSGEEPTIEVDSSAVDIETPGSYPVNFTVSDSAGNQTTIEATLNVLEKPIDPSIEEYVRNLAKTTVSQITNDSMDMMQKAYAIYFWTKNRITYTGYSDKSNYIIGARDGFTLGYGDCYTYYSVAKVMLEEIGVDIVDVRRHRASEEESKHFWMLINVGTGWYHFDCTVYSQPYSNFFMVTDEELKTWDSLYRPGMHNYTSTGMPELATESVQSRINYYSSWLA